jgi:diacylglycerol kinase family enzyme
LIRKIRFYCLVNKASGGCLGEELIKKLAKIGDNELFDITVLPLDFKNIKNQILQASNFDRLLIAGGDGTVSFVLSHLQGSGIPVGILPLGTGNDLAKEIGVSAFFDLNDLKRILTYYLTSQTKKLTIWKFQYGERFELERNFVNYLSIGFEPGVVEIFSKIRNNQYYFLSRFGPVGNRLAYVIASLFNLNQGIDLKGFNLFLLLNLIIMHSFVHFIFKNLVVA